MDEHFITVETPKAGAKMLVDVPKITLEWNHVSRVVKIKNTATKQTEDKVILDNVSGSAAPGELLVLMGPSGAGKSSLLDVISGRQKDYTGSVLVNGEKWTKKMNKLASYVLQDDIFYETLTVKEHLLFQAELRMGKTFDAAQREARVNYFFGAATPEFASVPIELPLMAREYYGGLYRSYVWYLAKNVSELFFQIFFPLVFLVPAYFMIGFGASNATLFFSLYMYIALLSSSATGLGYMVSCLAKTPDIAPIIGILIILPFLIFGGLFINTNNVPVYFSWLEFISPMKYAFRGMSRAFWTTVDTIPCDSTPCAATTGAQVLVNLALNKEDMAYDVGFLLWINGMFRVFGMIALALRLRGKK
ncbi:hypothetical protein SDRG_00899 [Saprolegnia diclina VS20]|uniref:ABC transporter domain-containing protein n=1 Tax=Saprolegnia diclina (strain VS20) TaxID=1156394 RepID=T0R529_SAPDV|nr:hypothetical protein SDRG_00899 [Saprolegnia diclina VS20]EQC42056.1 hypothetical protein SDRG_00899 [Saprolegnia diclina VS20]|eukprot:XP_008604625.1 hypothetical protein SDRG_00899 [Saprolegnia diclina VS20]